MKEIIKEAVVVPEIKNKTLVTMLPTMLGLSIIGSIENNKETHGNLYRFAADDGNLIYTNELAEILDRNVCFSLENMLKNTNGSLFCFDYEDSNCLIKRERSFLSIEIFTEIENKDEFELVTSKLEGYPNVEYFVKEIVDLENEKVREFNVMFIVPNGNSYLEIGVINFIVSANAQDVLESDFIKTGLENLREALVAYRSSYQHALLKLESKFNEDAKNYPEEMYKINNSLEKSKNLIKNFLQIEQISVVNGIDLNLMDILDNALSANMSFDKCTGKLEFGYSENEIYGFCLFLLLLNTSAIDARRMLIDNNDIEFDTAFDEMVNRTILRLKDLLCLSIASGKPPIDLAELSTSDAEEILTGFSFIEFTNMFFSNRNRNSGKIDILLTSLTDYTTNVKNSNGFETLITGMNILGKLKASLKESVEACRKEVEEEEKNLRKKAAESKADAVQ